MTEEERLLARLGETLRGRQEREGVAKLEARSADLRAPAQAPSDDAQAELFAPFSEKLRASMAERALRALSEGAPSADQPAPSPRPIRRRRSLAGLAALVASAAAAWLLWPGPRLPAYTFSLAGGDAALRGRPAEPSSQPVVLTPGSQLDLVLRPATPIEGPIEARLYVVGTSLLPVDRPGEVVPSGAVRWTGTVRELVGPRTGDVELLVVVGRRSSLPDVGELAASPAGRARTWQSFRARLRIVSER